MAGKKSEQFCDRLLLWKFGKILPYIKYFAPYLSTGCSLMRLSEAGYENQHYSDDLGAQKVPVKVV